MKHSESQTALLSRRCAESSIEASDQSLIVLVRYLNAVLAANETTNLTRITDPEQALRLHILDSLCALTEIRSAVDGPLCDIGTGAGFPGVPLAVVSGRDCTLLDSVRKKADIAAGILMDMGLDRQIRVSHDRAEQHARKHAGEYAVITARAVAPLASLAELAAPLLCDGGVLVALKGDPSQGELDSGDVAAGIVGLRLKSKRHFRLPGGDEQRCVIAYVKTGRSAVSLPRREGLAQHSPLG